MSHASRGTASIVAIVAATDVGRKCREVLACRYFRQGGWIILGSARDHQSHSPDAQEMHKPDPP
jgi:hypothetical protein